MELNSKFSAEFEAGNVYIPFLGGSLKEMPIFVEQLSELLTLNWFNFC
jgi:phage terminase large subunit-like protein